MKWVKKVDPASFPSTGTTRILALLASLIVPVLVYAQPERPAVTGADIYGWGVLTRNKLAVADVRRKARTITTIRDPHEARELVRWLALDRLADGVTDGDPRLVIDIWRQDGSRETYCSNGVHLYSENGAKRLVDESFLRRFTFAERW
jgi:hypothetical protein